ncbi:MAG: hypothetical protein NT105_18310 [Verrucomicrobia bacterium]|nr:hypothetical protein [Verrucomicrobiota bacterium]
MTTKPLVVTHKTLSIANKPLSVTEKVISEAAKPPFALEKLMSGPELPLSVPGKVTSVVAKLIGASDQGT